MIVLIMDWVSYQSPEALLGKSPKNNDDMLRCVHYWVWVTQAKRNETFDFDEF
jgi:hypothetical protein